MRVAILANFPLHVLPAEEGFPFPSGHYATWLPQLAEAFSKWPRFELHWVTLTGHVSRPTVKSWKGQTFHLLPTRERGRALTFYARDREQIRQCLEGIRPQLVHGWGTEDIYAFGAVASGYPHIVSMQGIISHYALKNRMSPRNYFQALLELYILRKAQCVTVESQWGAEVLRRRNPRLRPERIEYGVNHEFLDVAWKPDPAKPAALFVGSVAPRKGIHDAVAAFADPALAGMELWIAGGIDSPWSRELRERATPNVRWLGRVPTAEIASLMSRAWCLVLPTRADTSPNVVKEARVIGLPVVTSPEGGQSTYIQEGGAGSLVVPGDIDRLIRALRGILGDYGKCRAMGACQWEEHRHLLHPDRTAEAFAQLYERRIAQAPASL
ncbi:MAG TPA: glycosyltransferase family 4 protein [Chthoniobacteraceae bacterium]|nr:glycosyltransferase family 4 protein [Chthoniobacteraceae bacterium]